MKVNKLTKFKRKLLLGRGGENLINKLMEIERDTYYWIEKLTGQKVDDEYYAMKIEMFKEAFKNDPDYKPKEE